jgi:hypothetical protein
MAISVSAAVAAGWPGSGTTWLRPGSTARAGASAGKRSGGLSPPMARLGRGWVI